ncbi:MAG: prephenate dehydrogenase/arogenate dehydrogenase family protein [Methanomassiliicoccales archaeon]
MSDESIEKIREQIRRTDERIFQLVGKRVKLAERIGKAKRKLRAPLRDYTVEAQVMERAERICTSMGVDRSTARAVARELIRASLLVQSSSDTPVYSGEKKRILIVGGCGKMGTWFSSYFSVQGHEVGIHDIVPPVTNFRYFADLQEGMSWADVVLFSTPISVTPSLLKRAADSGADTLIIDACSLKHPLIPSLRSLAADGKKVASIHPLFGPSTRMLADQHLIVCDCGSKEAMEEAISLFSDTSLTIIRMGLEEHDEIMSVVLGATHAINIVMFQALASSSLSAEQLFRCPSTTFRKQMSTTVDVARENPSLYYEIQHLNPHRKAVFDSIQKAVDFLKEAAFHEQPDHFLSIMEKGREYFRGVEIE